MWFKGCIPVFFAIIWNFRFKSLSLQSTVVGMRVGAYCLFVLALSN